MSYANILHALTLLLVVLDAERRLLAVLGDERHAEVELATTSCRCSFRAHNLCHIWEVPGACIMIGIV